jgi:AraC-like DNA-binding protein
LIRAGGWADTARTVIFVTRRPAPPLDAHIDAIWLFHCAARPFTLERVLPTGGAQLIVNLTEDQTRTYDAATGRRRELPGSTMGGVNTRFQIIDTAEQEHVAGVAFRPGGTTAFFPTPASVLTDIDAPLDTLWGARATARLREQLLEATTPEAALDVLEWTLRAAYLGRARHPAVAFALDAFTRRPDIGRVGDVTSAIALSPKRFIERFKTEVGVTPKRYCRLLRFQHAVRRAHTARVVDWTDVAVACGYFDQAHFIHDFREFSGLTPTAYGAGRTAFQNHVTFLQSDGG